MKFTQGSRSLSMRRVAAVIAAAMASIGLTATPTWALEGHLQTSQTHQSSESAISAAISSTQGAVYSENPVEQERIHRLGVDPATGYAYRDGEVRTALRIESQRKITLVRAPEDSSADWVGPHGETYDAVGNFPSKYFDRQWPNLKRQIIRHLDKAIYVPVDISQFKAEQKAKVCRFILKHPEFGPRVFVVGQEESSEVHDESGQSTSRKSR